MGELASPGAVVSAPAGALFPPQAMVLVPGTRLPRTWLAPWLGSDGHSKLSVVYALQVKTSRLLMFLYFVVRAGLLYILLVQKHNIVYL